MTEIISRDVIKAQACRAVDAGKPITENPYLPGTSASKAWIAAYLTREIELEDAKQPVGTTFAFGAVEQEV